MSKSKFVAISAAGLLIAGGVLSAVPASATNVTLEVVGGGIAISVPVSANLGTWTNTVGGGIHSAALGQVQVTDARNGALGWTASAIMSALTPAAGPAIPATSIGYTTGTIAKVGTATYTGSNPTSLVGVSVVVTATGVTGDNSATWNPMINVGIAGTLAAGTYTAVITHSLS